MFDMQDYPSNSHHRLTKQVDDLPKTEKRVEKAVVKGVAKTKKQNGIQKFAKAFISEEVGNIKTSIINDILVPTFKKAVMNTIDMLLNGPSNYTGSSTMSSKISYRNFYDKKPDPRSAESGSVRSRFDFEDITYPNRGAAELVLDQMDALVSQYGYVTILDMYDLAGLTAPPTAHKYGWVTLRDAKITRMMDGDYIIRLPKANVID